MDAIPTPVGRLVLASKREVAPDPDSIVRDWGGAVIVCLNPERELRQWLGYSTWLRRNQPGSAIWFSMPDWEAPPLGEVMILFEDVVARLRAEKTVVMHCSHGMGRAGTIAVAVLMMLGVSRDDALVAVAAHRLGAGPQPGSQTALIADLEQRLAD